MTLVTFIDLECLSLYDFGFLYWFRKLELVDFGFANWFGSRCFWFHLFILFSFVQRGRGENILWNPADEEQSWLYFSKFVIIFGHKRLQSYLCIRPFIWKVDAIETTKCWCYISCSKCYRKLKREVASLTCPSCNDSSAVGVMRYCNATLAKFIALPSDLLCFWNYEN